MSDERGARAMEEPGHAQEVHVSARTYVAVAAVLAVLTAMEVMVFYVEALENVVLPVLMVLMVTKFALVVLFFMHLRFDSRILSGILAWGLVIATGIILALLAIFGKFAA